MNSWSNEDLARRLRPQSTGNGMNDAPRPPRPENAITTAKQAAPVHLTAVSGPPPVVPTVKNRAPSLQEVARAAEPLSEAEIRILFFALRRGTEARAQRQPTAGELQHLVEAVNRARQLQALAAAALSGDLNVYWDGSDWAFESREPVLPESLYLAA